MSKFVVYTRFVIVIVIVCVCIVDLAEMRKISFSHGCAEMPFFCVITMAVLFLLLGMS